MISAFRKVAHRYSLPDAIHATVASFLYDALNSDQHRVANLDRWTQQRISDENLAKVTLVLASGDPAEACYRDLLREIDLEAASGIFLVDEHVESPRLQHLLGEPGISGTLYLAMQALDPDVLPGSADFTIDEQYRTWDALHNRHARAHLDASVSEIIMSFMMDDAELVRDMTKVMRALTYTWHEDCVRRQSRLPTLLDERERRDLETMMSEMHKRSGDYQDRASEICRESDLRAGIPLS